jgi:hypothetical protein
LQVAWEWNMDKRWTKAWDRHPDTAKIAQAWGTSAEFVGRHLDDV